ncbi:DUF3592 domain-containing protein [Actinomadura sp. 9N407]|uniref:DUF3592 domain-containing protein n=1 Tax=Actinomadura sp. 9N407 TaxID=3375154 RepID=UPI0037B8A807
MDVHWIGVAIGLYVAYAGVSMLVAKIRLQLRGPRVPGVVAGRTDAAATRPGVVSRSGVVRFTTEDGRTVEATSSVHSFPGPKVGRQVTVVYDPKRPERTGERIGVHLFLLLVGAPLFIAVGAGIALLNYLDM